MTVSTPGHQIQSRRLTPTGRSTIFTFKDPGRDWDYLPLGTLLGSSDTKGVGTGFVRFRPLGDRIHRRPRGGRDAETKFSTRRELGPTVEVGPNLLRVITKETRLYTK